MNTEREIMKQIALKHIPEWVAENIKAGEKTFTSEFECMLAAMAEYGQHQAATIADLQQQLTDANRRGEELRECIDRLIYNFGATVEDVVLPIDGQFHHAIIDAMKLLEKQATATSKRDK